MKTKHVCFLTIMIMLISLFIFGCNSTDSTDYITEFETEFFKCEEIIMFNEVTIIGYTAKGAQLEEVIIPSYINGIKVTQIGKQLGQINNMSNAGIRKIFIPAEVQIGRADLFSGCSNLDKIIFLSYYPNFECPTSNALGAAHRYAPSDCTSNYLNNGYSTIRAANVSYMNNYSNGNNSTDNCGYYWIDDVNSGYKIITVPPDPSRNGYTFGGWYTETECVNIWNFETDIKGSEDLILYAQWIEVNN